MISIVWFCSKDGGRSDIAFFRSLLAGCTPEATTPPHIPVFHCTLPIQKRNNSEEQKVSRIITNIHGEFAHDNTTITFDNSNHHHK